MITKRFLLSRFLPFLIGAATAQTAFEPIVDGRRSQPMQQRFESRQSTAALEQGRRVQSEIDRLYGDVVAGSAPTGF
jgi:hypothetical protein